MIPTNNTLLTTEIEIVRQPTKTYKMDFEKKVIVGFCDEIDAMKQAIVKALDTERYDEIIYSWDYGAEMKTVYGIGRMQACSRIQDVITEALIQDDRIRRVTNFNFSLENKKELHISFTVETIFGDVNVERRVVV